MCHLLKDFFLFIVIEKVARREICKDGVRERETESLVLKEKILTGLREMKERGQGQTNAAEWGRGSEGRGGYYSQLL